MNAPAQERPDDEAVARAEAISAAFLERLTSRRQKPRRFQERRIVRVPVDVFEEEIEVIVG